jgi:HK97 family phage prohead protease
VERKLLPLEAAEFKFAGGTFEGYASVFNGIDSEGDTVLPGAYADTLKNRQRPIRMFFNHQSKLLPIGKWLDIGEDGHGLKVKGELTPGLSLAEDVKAAVAHGTVSGLSIGYRIPPGGSERDGPRRFLKRLDLIEVSVVTNPADLNARVESLKSCIEQIKSIRDFEEFLRDEGDFSNSEAKALISLARTLLRDEAPRDITSDIVTAILNPR